MAVAQSVVAALGIFLLFQTASALRACSWDIYGDKTDNDIQLGENVLPAGIPTFKVDIPDVCYGYTAGVKVTACDYDDPPQVLVISRSLAYISRKGSLSLNGRVTAKVYCYEDPILSLSSNQKEPPLSVHPLLDSRRAYRRATRSSENSHHVLNRIRSHQASNDDQRSTRLSHNNQADDSARDSFSKHNIQSSSETRNQQHELSKNNQAAVANTMNQSIRKALAAHIRHAAVEQARHNAAQKSRDDENSSEKRQQVINRSLRHALHGSELNSALDSETAHQTTKDVVTSKRAHKTSHSEQTSDEQRLAEQKRSRRDLQSTDNRQDDEDINDVSEETGSRSGSEHSNFQTREFSPTNDVVRQVLAANARQAAIAEASLRAINEAQFAAQQADARQANDVVRQTLKANALHSALAQASLQAMHEAMSRSAQANNVREAGNTNHVAKDNERQAKQARLLAARLLSHDSQRDYSSASNNYGERDTAADTARDPKSNQGYNSILHDAQRSSSQTRIALDARRANDRLRQNAEENADDAALRSHAHRAAINDALRTSHISAMINDHHSNHALRNQLLDSALQNNNYKGHLSDRISDNYQQSGHRRLRRASHSSEVGQAVDSSRDTKSDKMRQSHTSKDTGNNARIAEKKTDQQNQDLQKRSRRSLQFQSNPQAADSFESPLANERYHNSQLTDARLTSNSVYAPSTFDRRQAALNEAHFQFLLKTSRSGQAGSGKVNNNFASSKTEQDAFNHAHRQGLLDGQRNIEGIGTQREYNNQAHRNLVSDEQQDTLQTIQAARRYSLLPNSQHLTDAFRNAHEALLSQANLRALHEASRAGETSHLRHLNNLARESVLHNTENTLSQALGFRHNTASDSASDIREALKETARRAELEKVQNQAFDERRLNMDNNARDLANNIQETFADTARRFNLNQMHQQGFSKDHLSGATEAQLAESVRDALAERAHRATLDQVRKHAFGERGFNTAADAFHAANNIQKSIAETVNRANMNQAQRQPINEGRLSATMNARQRADHVRGSLADVARRATFDQARHQKLGDSHQSFSDQLIGTTNAHQIADNVRQAFAETARRATLDQALQQNLGGVPFTAARQTAENAGQTLRDIARRASLNQARLLASSEKGNVRQFLSSDVNSQKQAAYEENLNRQLSLQNSNLQGRYL